MLLQAGRHRCIHINRLHKNNAAIIRRLVRFIAKLETPTQNFTMGHYKARRERENEREKEREREREKNPTEIRSMQNIDITTKSNRHKALTIPRLYCVLRTCALILAFVSRRWVGCLSKRCEALEAARLTTVPLPKSLVRPQERSRASLREELVLQSRPSSMVRPSVRPSVRPFVRLPQFEPSKTIG